MSLSTRNYSKESRSSSYYSRSSSYHAGTNNSYNLSSYSRSYADARPLSVRLIERDYSWPSLSWNWDLDDPFYFDRIRWRLESDFLKSKSGIWRPLPIYYRTWNNSATRVIPIQYILPPRNHRAYLYKKIEDNQPLPRHDESAMLRENRLSSEDWPPRLGPPTRRRTSMTIFVQKPYIDQSDVPYYRQTPLTPTYPQSARIDYY